MIAHTTETTKARVPRKEFQLVAVTSLYLAIKLHGETDAVEGAPRKLRINAFVELSRGMFTIETLETMERAILSNLEWNVNPPTTVCFVASLLRLLPASWDNQPLHASVASSIFEMARYLTELSVCVSTFSFKFKSSEISYSAILCAIDALRDSVPLPYGARIAFLNSVAESTSLTPGTDKIRKCCGMIMELCPSLFIEPDTPASGGLSRSSSISSAPGNTISPSEEARISPVCVEQVFKEEFTQRKRIRSNRAEHRATSSLYLNVKEVHLHTLHTSHVHHHTGSLSKIGLFRTAYFMRPRDVSRLTYFKLRATLLYDFIVSTILFMRYRKLIVEEN